MEHSPIPNCLIYHEAQENTCIECEQGNIFFRQVNQCKLGTSVEHCRTYLDASTCQECRIDYSLKEGVCELNEDNPFCAEVVGNECVKCHKGYLLISETKMCSIQIIRSQFHCLDFTIENNSVSCSTC